MNRCYTKFTPLVQPSAMRSLTLALVAAGFVTPLFAGQTIIFPDTPVQASTGATPNLMLPISVEFPTVGSGYNGSQLGLSQSLVTDYMRAANAGLAYVLAANGNYQYGTISPTTTRTRRNVDSWFDPDREYVGYWRSDRCYDYSTVDTYFSESAVAANMRCSGAGTTGRWSGNFLNWSQTSAIDVLRLVMTGGQRFIDEPARTVLERAKMFNSQLQTFTYSGPPGPGAAAINNSTATQPIKEIGRSQSAIRAGILNVDPKLFTPFDRDVVRVLFLQDTFTVEAWTLANATNPRNDVTPASYESLTMYPRVKVCDSTLGAVNTNCIAYAGGSKPTGEIQRKANSLRFSAFGYLMDDVFARDGGVMRASMRYTGPKSPDATGNINANPQAEWDANGVFYTNPDGAAEGNSGVINYLNKFGLVAGRYKTYDNWGELYSESLRYLLGRPKAQAESVLLTGDAAVDAKLKDGFPIYKDWVDPIQNSCQKSYILTIGDTNTHCDGRVPGMRELQTAANQCEDKGYPAETITGIGGQASVTIDAGVWANNISAGLATTKTGSGDRGTYSMAGLAYFANAQNVRPDKADSDIKIKTYVIDVNEGSSILFPNRAGWLAAKYGGFDDKTTPPVFPPVPDTGEWEKPSIIPGVPNGVQPKTFFLASDGKALRDSLQAAIEDITTKGAGSGKLASSAGRITSTASGVFQTEVETSSWTGDLLRKNVSFATGTLTAGSTAWRAAPLLTGDAAASPAIPATVPSARKIVTYSGTAGVDFTWSTIPATLQTELRKAYLGQTGTRTVAEATERLDWIRGDRTLESAPTNALRKRINLLGDAGNTSPIFVGKPGADGYDEKEYFDFARAKKTRQDAVYLGTSEGMLHAFNADTGRELFAYVPSQLHAKIAASPAKGYSRKPMVDATPTIVDAKLPGGNWGTALVGGLGGGGTGVYALNVTDPSAFNAGSVLWEFTSANDPEVGYITSPPTLTRLADGRHVVMFGSGYNNSSGDGYLFVLRLDRAAGTAWAEGTNYVKIKLTSNPTTANAGVSQPMASRDARGNANRVYVGDLDGNMHRIVVPPLVSGAVSLTASNWTNTTIFSATSSTPNKQPITVAPALVFHPKGGVVVLFGTGKLMETSDRSATNVKNTFYAVWDNDSASGTYPLSRAKLSSRTFLESNGKRTIATTTLAPRYDDPAATRQYGWYAELDSSKSESVTFPANVDVPENVDFTTSLGITTCTAGSGFYMSLDPVSGLTRAPTLDLNGDGVINASDVFAGLATLSTPGQVSVVKLDRPGDPYGAVSYVKFIGSKLTGLADPTGLGATVQKYQSKYGRLNYRQITEIKR
jgi:type IV pilus assembly protein PilY1